MLAWAGDDDPLPHQVRTATIDTLPDDRGPDASVGSSHPSPLLVVEIRTRINDTVTKRAAYAEAGVPAYWIVDPSDGQRLALRPADGGYEVYAEGAVLRPAATWGTRILEERHGAIPIA